RQFRPEMAWAQPEPGFQLFTERPAPVAGEEDGAVVVGIDDRRVADGIRAARDPRLDLAQCDLVADEDAGLQAGAAGALQIHPRRRRGEPRADDGFAGEIPVAR